MDGKEKDGMLLGTMEVNSVMVEDGRENCSKAKAADESKETLVELNVGGKC